MSAIFDHFLTVFSDLAPKTLKKQPVEPRFTDSSPVFNRCHKHKNVAREKKKFREKKKCVFGGFLPPFLTVLASELRKKHRFFDFFQKVSR
jgi:hypothetical protein